MPAQLLEVDLGPGVRAAFTTRRGGVSTGPWAELDLALHVGDDPAAVRRNRALLADAFGAPIRYGQQVHGTTVVTVDAGSSSDAVSESDAAPESDVVSEAGDAGEDECDAFVTGALGLGLGVLVADCLPVLLADPAVGVIATAHAGRRGLADGILQAVVRAMVKRGARPERIRAAVGPGAGPCCYEVPERLRDEVAAVLPSTAATTRRGTPSLDLPAGAVEALGLVGVQQVQRSGICTIDDERFFSYRRAAGEPTGRFAGIVRRVPA